MSYEPLMVLAAGASSRLQQIDIHPFMQLSMAIREGERCGITVVHGRPVIDGIGEPVEITIIDAFRILVQKHEGIRRTYTTSDITVLIERFVTAVDLGIKQMKARVGSHIAIH
jgi:hypothetical protein